MRSSGGLISLAAFVIVIFGMQSAQSIMVPFLLAVFISIIATPILLWLEKLGLPRILSFIIVTCGVIGILLLIGLIVTTSINSFLGSIPEIQKKLTFLMQSAIEWVDSFGYHIDIDTVPLGFDPNSAISAAGMFLRSLSQILSSSFLIFIMVTFMLFETVSMRAKLEYLASRNPDSLQVAEKFVQNLKRYLAIKTVASFATGVIIGGVLSFMGIKYAILWGLLAFLLNYIPTIGSIIAAIPAVLVTLVEADLGSVAWVACVFLFVNIAIGNFIEPRFLGRGLGDRKSVV